MKTATKPKPLPVRFRPYADAAPPGRIYLVIGLYCWGKDADLAKAIAKCRNASGGEFKPGSSRAIVYHAHPETVITRDGCIETPAGKENHAVELATLGR